MRPTPPVIGFAAPSGTGKTTLMALVIAQLRHEGFHVGAIKHGHHPADPDKPGKDTHRFRQAGAKTVLFACPERWFLIQELDPGAEPDLDQQLTLFAHHDLVLVEGYKDDDHPKIAIYRDGVTDPETIKRLTNIIAIATDMPELAIGIEPAPPLLDLNDPQAVSKFICHFTGLVQRADETS
ncbi:MAG: molybdopterin-guanine dinucleotide biosynthesis protein B [Magnetococcus sp. THC-1_WYH]